MPAPPTAAWTACALLACIVAASGCASPGGPWRGGAGSEVKKKHRELISVHEQRRTQAQLAAARASWQQGDLDEARRYLEGVLKRAPRDREARLLLADLLVAMDRPEQAVEELKTARADHPGDAQIEHTLGMLLAMLERRDEALAHLRAAAELAPDDEAIRADLAAISRRAASLAGPGDGRPGGPEPSRLGDGDDKRVDTVWPDGPAGQQVAGIAPEVLAAGGSDWAERVERLYYAGRGDEAAHALRRLAASPHSSAAACLRAANLALRHSEEELAAELARRGVELHGRHAGLYRLLGAALYRSGDYEASQVALEQALALDSRDPLTYFLMGSVLAKRGQPAEAARHLARAEALDPRYRVRR